MTHVSYTLVSPKSRIASISYTLGRNQPLTYDQLVVGFARSLADFMLNNDTISESDLISAISRVRDALASVSIQERTHDNRI